MRRHLQGWKLRFPVIGIVPAGLVELQLADMRACRPADTRRLTSSSLMKLSEDSAHDRPLGHPEDQALPDQGRDGEQVQLACPAGDGRASSPLRPGAMYASRSFLSKNAVPYTRWSIGRSVWPFQ